MSTPTLATYLFGYNLNRIAYPWRASIRSAIALSHCVYFCACDSEDDTWEDAVSTFRDEIGDGRLVILRHPWGTHFSIQAHIANYILDKIGTKYDFALKLDADEVLHEASFEALVEDLSHMAGRGYLLGKPKYIHFCPDFDTTWPFIYDSKAVLMRTRTGLRFNTDQAVGNADACALGGRPEYQTRLVVHHYGKVSMGREREALYKERSFQQLYTELGFPDPKVEAQADQGYLNYMKVFDISLERGEFKAFTGTHPIFVKHWIKQMRERHAEFATQLYTPAL